MQENMKAYIEADLAGSAATSQFSLEFMCYGGHRPAEMMLEMNFVKFITPRSGY